MRQGVQSTSVKDIVQGKKKAAQMKMNFPRKIGIFFSNLLCQGQGLHWPNWKVTSTLTPRKKLRHIPVQNRRKLNNG